MIRVWKGDAATLEVEGLLRPVGAELEPVTPLSRQLELGAGPGVQDRLREMESLPVGGAAITPGGDLEVGFLIHVVIQSREEPTSEFAVQQALLNGLRRASEWGIGTLAVPPLGTGAGNLDAETAASLMVPVILRHLRAAGVPREVVLVVSSDYEEDAFRREVERAGPVIAGERD